MILFSFVSVCKERFKTRTTLRKHQALKKGTCQGKTRLSCFFCGYAPAGLPFEDIWRLGDHCLGDLCRWIMKSQWESKEPFTQRVRYKLFLSTEENVLSFMKARNLPSMKTVLQRKSSFNYMPSLEAINATLRDKK